MAGLHESKALAKFLHGQLVLRHPGRPRPVIPTPIGAERLGTRGTGALPGTMQRQRFVDLRVGYRTVLNAGQRNRFPVPLCGGDSEVAVDPFVFARR